MVYALNCVVFGEKTIFQVDIDEVQSVYKLKKAIKTEYEPLFNDVTAQLTLYKLASDVGENKSEVEDIAHKRFDLKKQALDPRARLATVLSNTANLENIVHILVVPPQGKSIDPWACGAVAGTRPASAGEKRGLPSDDSGRELIFLRQHCS